MSITENWKNYDMKVEIKKDPKVRKSIIQYYHFQGVPNMKIAFVYGGQGSQKVGMGKDLYEGFSYIYEFYESIELDIPLKKLSFFGDLKSISKTRHAQLIILIFQLAVTKILEKNKIRPDTVLGLSLGEYSALYAAGVLNIKDVIGIIDKRSKLMEEIEKRLILKCWLFLQMIQTWSIKSVNQYLKRIKLKFLI